MIASLVTLDPEIHFAIVSKENIAARSLANSILSHDPSEDTLALVGRLISDQESFKEENRTCLDILHTARGDAIKKNALISTGGTFASDWHYQYSPIKSWHHAIHIAFVEEAQQFGGIHEVVVVAEMFHDCLVVFGGGRQQTPRRN